MYVVGFLVEGFDEDGMERTVGGRREGVDGLDGPDRKCNQVVCNGDGGWLVGRPEQRLWGWRRKERSGASCDGAKKLKELRVARSRIHNDRIRVR